MMQPDEITLVLRTKTRDAAGYLTQTTPREVTIPALSGSVTRSEFYAGLRAGQRLTASFRVVARDYPAGVDEIVHSGKRYKPVRTYCGDGYSLEISCEEVLW